MPKAQCSVIIASSSSLSFRSSHPHQCLSPKPFKFLLLSRSFTSQKLTNWKTSHSLVQSNPLLSLLHTCKCLSHLKKIQALMTVTGLISDPFASSRLIAFCALSESRNLAYCVRILFSSERTNAFSWNVAIKGFSELESPSEALKLYKKMVEDGRGSKPDGYTFSFVLKACAKLGLNSVGFQVLAHVLKFGLRSCLLVHNSAIHMLILCGDLKNARKLFDESSVRDLVSWNTLINGFARAGLACEALGVYREMEIMGFNPDEVTMVGLISACAKLEDLKNGRNFHRLIVEKWLTLTAPLANTLMHMYVKCDNLEAAKKLFDEMTIKTAFSWTTLIAGYARSGCLEAARKLLCEIPETEKSVEPWNAMISGYVQAKFGKEALTLFQEMQCRDIIPDEITMVGTLSACTQLGALDIGIWIHRYLEKHMVSVNVALGTALVDMYAKCGNIKKALQVFGKMPERNFLTWTAVITGLALHGCAREAIFYFEKMIDEGIIPDEITMLGVLSACCHGGLVEEGRNYFSEMRSRFDLFPDSRHYSCMVDLLGRAGRLEEAEKLIQSMPVKADARVWGALFSACHVHKNVAMGERAFSKLLELEPSDSGNYVMLMRMYKEAKRWNDAENVRELMSEGGVDKTPGCSSIEVNGIVCEFKVGDDSHHRSKEIYQCLVRLTREVEILQG